MAEGAPPSRRSRRAERFAPARSADPDRRQHRPAHSPRSCWCAKSRLRGRRRHPHDTRNKLSPIRPALGDHHCARRIGGKCSRSTSLHAEASRHSATSDVSLRLARGSCPEIAALEASHLRGGTAPRTSVEEWRLSHRTGPLHIVQQIKQYAYREYFSHPWSE